MKKVNETRWALVVQGGLNDGEIASIGEMTMWEMRRAEETGKYRITRVQITEIEEEESDDKG